MPHSTKFSRPQPRLKDLHAKFHFAKHVGFPTSFRNAEAKGIYWEITHKSFVECRLWWAGPKTLCTILYASTETFIDRVERCCCAMHLRNVLLFGRSNTSNPFSAMLWPVSDFRHAFYRACDCDGVDGVVHHSTCSMHVHSAHITWIALCIVRRFSLEWKFNKHEKNNVKL